MIIKLAFQIFFCCMGFIGLFLLINSIARAFVEKKVYWIEITVVLFMLLVLAGILPELFYTHPY